MIDYTDELFKIFEEYYRRPTSLDVKAFFSPTGDFDYFSKPIQRGGCVHRCPDCKNTWICKDPYCDSEGEDYQCPTYSARKYDCNPDTRMGYPGAFKEWEKANI